MARIRSIKPDFFRHPGLYAAERESGLPLRVAFAGLWTVADREGRFKWRPPTLKLDCLPFDDVSMVKVLDALALAGFIKQYGTDGAFGYIPTFKEHQHVNMREPPSNLPPPDDVSHGDTCTHVQARVEGEREGKGQEGEGSESRAHARATRWPHDAVVSDDWITLGNNARAKHNLPPIDLRLEAERFQNYWASKAGGNAAKSDWEKTWVNWVLRSEGGSKSANRGRGVFAAIGDRLRETSGKTR